MVRQSATGGLLADRRTADGDRPDDRYVPLGRRHHRRRLVPAGTSGAGNAPTALRRRSHDGVRRRGSCGAGGRDQDPAVAGAITTLSTDLPAYSGVVQEANFSERQANYPLAAAYLTEANNLMRTGILPAAALVYGTEVKRLADDQGNAASTWLTVLAALGFFALLAALVVAQRWLSGRFHRTWNVALAGATALVVVFGSLGRGRAPHAEFGCGVGREQRISAGVDLHGRPDPRTARPGRRRVDSSHPRLGHVVSEGLRLDGGGLEGPPGRESGAKPRERPIRAAAIGTHALRMGRLLVGPPAGPPCRLVRRPHERSGAGLGSRFPRPARRLRRPQRRTGDRDRWFAGHVRDHDVWGRVRPATGWSGGSPWARSWSLPWCCSASAPVWRSTDEGAPPDLARGSEVRDGS